MDNWEESLTEEEKTELLQALFDEMEAEDDIKKTRRNDNDNTL